MKILILLSLILVLPINLWAYDDCGNDPKEKELYHLNWSQVGIYQVNSVFVNVVGVICAGVDVKSSSVEYLNYRDNFGVKVYKDKKTLLSSDVPYLQRNDFAAAARWLTRPDHPLTVRISKITKIGKSTKYEISLKFLRNVRKSFYASDVRDLKVDLFLNPNSSNPKVEYKNLDFTKISLGISGSLNISSVILYDGDVQALRINPYDLPRGDRKL